MAQAPTVDLPKRLPLATEASNRDSSVAKDSRLINAYAEKNKVTGDFEVFKRPGLSQTGSTQTGNGLGVYNWLGDVYSIFGATMYKNGVALIGVLDTTGGVYRFSDSKGDIPRMQFGNGVATYNLAGTTITQINPLTTVTAGSFVVGIEYTILSPGTTNFTLIGAANNNVGTVFTATGAGTGTGTATTPNNFPVTTVKGIAYLDSTTYVMDANASIRGCTTLNDPTDWTDLLNRITAQIESDGGVALAKQLVYVIALGEWSTEVFYDALNATGSPLGPVQGAKINYGCRHQDSVRELDGILFWLATNRGAAPQVVMMENLKAQVISTPAIDRLLGNLDYTTVFSWTLKFEGHRFYGLTIKNANLTLVYDVTERMWEQWTDASGNYWPIVDSSFSTALGPILQHETNGKLYQCDDAYTTDDGAILTVDIYTPNFDGGTRRIKYLSVMEFLADRTPGSVLQVRSNDSDYAVDGWTNFRRVDLNQARPTLTANGSFVRRAYHIRHAAAAKMRLQGIELQMDLGTL